MPKKMISDRCHELLYSLYLDFQTNQPHVEALHEMFISFAGDYRRNDQVHDQVVNSYVQLRYLMMEAEKLFQEKAA